MKYRGFNGQGVIEYAGAIVIAVVLVGASMTIGVDNLTSLFVNVLDSVKATLMGVLNAL